MSLAADLLGSRAALEEGSRDRAHATYLGEGTALCRVLGKFLIYVDTQDMGLVPYLCLDGFWESWVTLAIARIIRPGWHCVDIGANHGYFTLLMADATGPTGRALAVEPNPRLADYARRSIEVNGLKEIGAVAQMAVSDRVGESVRLSHPTRHAHLANPFHAVEGGETVEGWETAEVWETFPAMTTTLDDLTRDWPRLDLVKIDAEGMEEVIWSGGHATWER